MVKRTELFIGLTSWNSELFLPHCLKAIHDTVGEADNRIVVLDNASTDSSPIIARDMGCEVIIGKCELPDALNALLEASHSKYTLLIHSDTILLSNKWYGICKKRISGNTVLVSPQDIGCGPFTRPWGAGKPESSFMFFLTDGARKIRTNRWVRRFRMPYPRKVVDFYVQNVTHNLPERLMTKGFSWQRMRVHVSDRVDTPIYEPDFEPICWTEELGHLRYGLGNFYSVDGVITHYHNWFDRLLEDVPLDSRESDIKQGGIPNAYITAYTMAFLSDLQNHCIVMPDLNLPERVPRRLLMKQPAEGC